MNRERSARIIPPDLISVQIEASDPEVSAWVAANAGAGKTHVLAQRVMRLLLDGINPAKILCITFTKAAAANMANRIFEELRRWTALDNDALDRAIRAISGLPRSPPAAHWRGGCLRWRWKHRAVSKCRPSTPSARGCCSSFPSRRTWPP